jgi:hypothetical protein
VVETHPSAPAALTTPTWPIARPLPTSLLIFFNFYENCNQKWSLHPWICWGPGPLLKMCLVQTKYIFLRMWTFKSMSRDRRSFYPLHLASLTQYQLARKHGTSCFPVSQNGTLLNLSRFGFEMTHQVTKTRCQLGWKRCRWTAYLRKQKNWPWSPSRGCRRRSSLSIVLLGGRGLYMYCIETKYSVTPKIWHF